MGTSNLETIFCEVEKINFSVPPFPRQDRVKIIKTLKKSETLHNPLKQPEEYHQLGVFGKGFYIKEKDHNFFL